MGGDGKVGDQPLAVTMLQMQAEAAENGTELKHAGLQLLKGLDGLYIKQEWEILEQITSWYEQQNEYAIYNNKQQSVKLFRAKEKTTCCWRMCCAEHRPFTIKLYDTTSDRDQPVFLFKRKFACCGFAPLGCNHNVDVHYLVDPNGNSIASHSSRTKVASVQVPPCHGGCCIPTLNVKKEGKTTATVQGGTCLVCDCCGADFGVNDAKGRRMGKISKLRPKTLKQMAMEVVSEADNFKVEFSRELDEISKVALVAAVLQLDFAFFEDSRGICECKCCDCYACGATIPCIPAICFTVFCFCCDNSDKKKKKNARDRRGAPNLEEMER